MLSDETRASLQLSLMSSLVASIRLSDHPPLCELAHSQRSPSGRSRGGCNQGDVDILGNVDQAERNRVEMNTLALVY